MRKCRGDLHIRVNVIDALRLGFAGQGQQQDDRETALWSIDAVFPYIARSVSSLIDEPKTPCRVATRQLSSDKSQNARYDSEDPSCQESSADYETQHGEWKRYQRSDWTPPHHHHYAAGQHGKSRD